MFALNKKMEALGLLEVKRKKTNINNSGYLRFSACIGNRRYVTKLVHRAVAEAFIENENPSILVEVNHLNENKLDNRVENLRWVTHIENIMYGSCVEKIKNGQNRKKLIATNIGNGEVRHFNSIRDAGRNGFSLSSVWKCCKGIIPHTKGWRIEYE